MDRKALAKAIRDVSYLTGEFKLRSGKTSTFYWDKYRFESDPTLLRAIAEQMATLLPNDFDKLAGLEMGGIPIATAIALETGRRSLFIRKTAKEYGTCQAIEGGFSNGDRCVVIEDVITTAGQVCESVGEMRKAGLIVTDTICAIDRQQGGAEKIAAIECSLTSLFTLSELE